MIFELVGLVTTVQTNLTELCDYCINYRHLKARKCSLLISKCFITSTYGFPWGITRNYSIIPTFYLLVSLKNTVCIRDSSYHRWKVFLHLTAWNWKNWMRRRTVKLLQGFVFVYVCYTVFRLKFILFKLILNYINLIDVVRPCPPLLITDNQLKMPNAYMHSVHFTIFYKWLLFIKLMQLIGCLLSKLACYC